MQGIKLTVPWYTTHDRRRQRPWQHLFPRTSAALSSCIISFQAGFVLVLILLFCHRCKSGGIAEFLISLCSVSRKSSALTTLTAAQPTMFVAGLPGVCCHCNHRLACRGTTNSGPSLQNLRSPSAQSHFQQGSLPSLRTWKPSVGRKVLEAPECTSHASQLNACFTLLLPSIGWFS